MSGVEEVQDETKGEAMVEKPVKKKTTKPKGEAKPKVKAKATKAKATKTEPKAGKPAFVPPPPPAFLAKLKLAGLPSSIASIDADGWAGVKKLLHEAHRYAAAQWYLTALARYSRNGKDPERQKEAAADVERAVTDGVKQVFDL